MRILITLLMSVAPARLFAHELAAEYGAIAQAAHHWFSLHHVPALILIVAAIAAFAVIARRATSKS
jgi:hypothetical protein